MFSTFYFKLPRQARILILFLIIILAAFFVLRFLAVEPRNIPQDFLRARQEASLIAQDIVVFSNESSKRIEEVSRLDEERKYTEALVLISAELERNKQAREKAIELSGQLEIMAKNLAQISPSAAGQKALEALSSETALISRLIIYNDYLTQLLEILREKFLGRNEGDKIQELLGKANDEARAINDLNGKFNEVMRAFDAE
ncbi:hypothetical protein HYV91_01230 [Candidatus Wolfebacteria bacterium]|nr:hypothetical protein [Candidatus Wolfebacteria bacterium]